MPTGEVIPGLKMLFVWEELPVELAVMSVIRTIQGEEQDTLEFHEPEPIGNCAETLTAPGADPTSSAEAATTPDRITRASSER